LPFFISFSFSLREIEKTISCLNLYIDDNHDFNVVDKKASSLVAILKIKWPKSFKDLLDNEFYPSSIPAEIQSDEITKLFDDEGESNWLKRTLDEMGGPKLIPFFSPEKGKEENENMKRKKYYYSTIAFKMEHYSDK